MFTCPASAPCCPLGAPRAPICARRPFSACRATRPLASDLLLCMCSRPLLPCMHIVRRTQHGRMPTHIERLRHEHLRRLSSGTPSRRTLDRWAPCRAMLRRAVPCCARSAAPSRQTLDRWAPGRCRGTGRASYNSQGAISLDTPARQCHMATVSWQRSPPTASLRAPPPPPTHTHTPTTTTPAALLPEPGSTGCTPSTARRRGGRAASTSFSCRQTSGPLGSWVRSRSATTRTGHAWADPAHAACVHGEIGTVSGRRSPFACGGSGGSTGRSTARCARLGSTSHQTRTGPGAWREVEPISPPPLSRSLRRLPQPRRLPRQGRASNLPASCLQAGWAARRSCGTCAAWRTTEACS